MAKIMEKIKKIFSTQIIFKPKPHVSAEGGSASSEKSEKPEAQPEKPQPEQKPEEQKQQSSA